jgi:hypothetical protein
MERVSRLSFHGGVLLGAKSRELLQEPPPALLHVRQYGQDRTAMGISASPLRSIIAFAPTSRLLQSYQARFVSSHRLLCLTPATLSRQTPPCSEVLEVCSSV